MKKLPSILALIFAVGLIGTIAYYNLPKGYLGVANTYNQAVRSDLLGSSDTLRAISATTTAIKVIENTANHIDLNIKAITLNSTTTVLSVVPYFSNNVNCENTNYTGTNWFSESGLGVSGATVSVSSPLVYQFSMASGTNSFNLGWNNLAARCVKLSFYTNNMATVSTTAWAETVVKY